MDSSVAGNEFTGIAADEHPSWKITIDLDNKKQKQRFVKKFRRNYVFSGSCDSREQRTCIWSGGSYSWQERYLGIMWIAVHGMNSVCGVTRNKLDMTHVGSVNNKSKPRETLSNMMKTFIYEIEDDIQSVKKPFGVVSVSVITDRNKKSPSKTVGAKCAKKETVKSASSKEKTKSNRMCTQAVDAKRKEAVDSDNSTERLKSYPTCTQAVDVKCDDKEAVNSDSSTEKTHSNSTYTQAGDAKCDLKEAIDSDSSTEKTESYSLCTVDAKCDDKMAIDSNSSPDKRKSVSTCALAETTQASGAGFDKKEATSFLTEKMKSVSAALTFDETIQTAIAAFQHLCRQKFKADEILVSVMKDTNSRAVSALEAGDIEKHLAVINNTEWDFKKADNHIHIRE